MTQMKYPYTLGAQLQQFPYKYYYTKNWVFRSWVWGLAMTAPIMAYITYKVNSGPAKPAKSGGHH